MISTIQQELKQTRPFSSKTQEAALSLLRTADMVRRAIGTVVERHDITPQQYNVLRILRGAGEHGLPTLEVVERLIEEAPGITRLIDRLEVKKLVKRQRCETDRRRVWCRITKEGLALLEKLDGPIREADRTALASLTSSEVLQLISLLDKARASLSSTLKTEQHVPRRI